MSFKAAFEAPCNYCNGDHSVEDCRSLPNDVIPEIPEARLRCDHGLLLTETCTDCTLEDSIEYWQEHSDLFAPPNVIHDGGVE